MRFNVFTKWSGDVLSYGVVWCGVVWCGVVWCGVVWCGVVWRCGLIRLKDMLGCGERTCWVECGCCLKPTNVSTDKNPEILKYFFQYFPPYHFQNIFNFYLFRLNLSKINCFRYLFN